MINPLFFFFFSFLFFQDPVVSPYVPALQRLFQKEVFLDLCKPYANISLPFVANKINATPEETENLLVEMILDGQVKGKNNS